jgi:hypothetical protein
MKAVKANGVAASARGDSSKGRFSPHTVTVAGRVATAGFLVAAVLQLLLATGVLPIESAWGGTQHPLTALLRVASLLAAGLLLLCLVLIKRRAEPRVPSRRVVLGAWLVTSYMGLNSLANLLSSSRDETLIFGPLSLLLTLSCLVVSLGPARGTHK